METFVIYYKLRMSHNEGQAIVIANSELKARDMLHKKWTVGAMSTIAITSVTLMDKPIILQDLYD